MNHQENIEILQTEENIAAMSEDLLETVTGAGNCCKGGFETPSSPRSSSNAVVGPLPRYWHQQLANTNPVFKQARDAANNAFNTGLQTPGTEGQKLMAEGMRIGSFASHMESGQRSEAMANGTYPTDGILNPHAPRP